MNVNRKRRILVLGLGISGRACAAYLLTRDAEVFAFDDDIASKGTSEDVQKLQQKGLHLLSRLDDVFLSEIDEVIASPGIASSHPVLVYAKQKQLACFGEADFAMNRLKNPIVGVTGTNGKTTVTYLIQHMLAYAGKKAVAAGNCGKALTDILCKGLDDETIIIAELSSYQLEQITEDRLEAAVILNISPDHLNRYDSMEKYAEAKFNIAKSLKQGKPLIINEKLLEEWPKYIENKQLFIFGQGERACMRFENGQIVYTNGSSRLDGIQRYDHHMQNLLAAISVCAQLGMAPNECIKACDNFKRPEHRIEYLGELDGVSFYNDSKGTNLDAVICAVASINATIRLVAGGVHKGASYACWKKNFNNVKSIYAIGEAKERLKEDLFPEWIVGVYESLQDAVFNAFADADEGDAVLLSPGCASYDMFKDFEHRGNVFKELFKQLQGKEKSNLTSANGK